MAMLINHHDWENTSLGSKLLWPRQLLFTLDLMLHSAFPMFLFWGKDYAFFYNDAFRATVEKEGKHPGAIGAPARVVWAETWEAIEPIVQAFLEGKSSALYEEQFLPVLLNSKQEAAYWTFSYTPVKNDEGFTEGVLAICHETTHKVRERKTADNLREQLQLAIEACDLGTWELDPQRMVFKCNHKTKEIFGLDNLEDIDLQAAVDVIDPADRTKVQAAINHAFDYKSGGRYTVEYTVIHPGTGDHRIVRANGKVSFNSNQSPERFAGTIQDITDEKLYWIRKEKLHQLVENSNDYMSTATLDGILTYINPAGRTLVGLDPATDLSALHIRDFYTEEQFARIRQEVIPVLEKTGQWAGFVKVRHQQSGEEIPCHGNYILIQDPATGKVISRGLTLHDLRPDIQARKELEESEKRFRNLVQEAPVATAIYTGREMRIQWANDAMIKLWGKDKSVIGKTIREALPELEDQPFHSQLDDVFTTGKMYQATEDKGELVVDGALQTFYFNFSYKPLYDTEGKVYGILNMAIDVTETVKNKRKLEESENAFRNLIMQAPVGICVLKGDDLIVDIVNDQYLNLVGRPRNQFEHRPLWEVLPEAKGQGFDQLLNDVKNTGIPYLGNEQKVDLIRNGTAEVVYVNFVYEPLFDENGIVHSILVIVIDISQQVKLRQLIENAEERARLAVASANLGAYEVNLLTGNVIASDRFNELFDIDQHAMQVDYISRIHPDDLQAREQAHETALKTGLLQYECRVQRRDGRQNWIQVNGQVYFNAEQEAYKIIGIVQDINVRKNVEQELERRVRERTAELVRLNEELQQFTYVSSHDLKEPLRKIQVFGSLAKDQADPHNAKLITSLDKVVHSAGRMSSLLNDLIQYTALSGTGKTFTRVDLNTVLKHVLDDCELLIREKNALIQTTGLPVIEGVEFQLARLFFNLLQNALKYSKPGSVPVVSIFSSLLPDAEKLALSLPVSGSFYKIEVRDNGIGFKQELAEKIFVVFQRLHDRSTFSGNGIGLALCKKVVEIHHGKIYAASVVNEGSTFTVILPQQQRTGDC